MNFKWKGIGWSAFLVLLAVTLVIPNYYGSKVCPPGKKFLGITGLYVNDTYYYMAFGPAQALSGKILFSDPFGRMKTANIFINPIANVIALISWVTQSNLSIAFLIFRIIAAWFLVLCFAHLARQFISSPFALFTAVIIYCFGAGFGLIFHWLGFYSVDNSIPEANMFIAMCGEYYIPLANALFILTLHFAYLTFFRNENKTFYTGVLLTLLGTVYVYGMIAASIIIATTAIYNGFKTKNWASTIKKGMVMACFCLPVVVYYIWLLSQIPDNQVTSNWFNSPSPIEYIFSFGLTLFLALAGWILSIAEGETDSIIFLLIWITTTITLIYIPISYFPFQQQMIIGIGAPLSILCCLALQNIWKKISPQIPHSFAMAVKLGATLLLLIVICSTNVSFYMNEFDQLKKGGWPEYISSNDNDAMQWCRKNIPDNSFVLISRKLGLILSATTAHKVGYDVLIANETAEEHRNTDLWKRLLSSKSDKQLKYELHKTGANYLFLDMPQDGMDYPQLRKMLRDLYKECYANSEVSIFQLQ